MIRIKKFCKNHIYAFTFFVFLVLYNFVVVSECKLPVISELVYSFHAVDYSMGFCSQMLPGAIFNFFHDQINNELVLIHEIILLLLLFLAVAFFCEKLIKKAPFEYRKTVLTFIFFFLSGPATFAVYVRDIGSLDVYWVFSVVFFLVCLNNKRLYPLMVIPFVTCVLVHYASFICFIPFFVILTLYRISTLDDKKEKKLLWSVLIVSIVADLVLTVYFIMFQRASLAYTLEEFHAIFDERNVTWREYYDWNFYQTGKAEIGEKLTLLNDESISFFKLLLLQIQLTINLYIQYSERFGDVIKTFILILPILVLFFAFIVKKIKNNKVNKLMVFSLISSFVLFFATNFAALMLSNDRVRWLAHAFLALAVTVLYINYIDKQSPWHFFHNSISKKHVILLILYYFLYSTNLYDLYA